MSNLVRYEAAVQAIAECRSVDEVKDWSDKAAAMQAYGRMAKDKTLEVDAAEIRIRAERRLGQMLEQQKSEGGLSRGAAGNPGGRGAKIVRSSDTTAQTPTLADAGISKDLSSRAQKLAAVPEDEFEKEVGEWRENVKQEGERVTARLEAAGDRAQKGKSKPPTADSSEPDPRDAEIADLKERIAELTANLEETLADNTTMAKVFDANDQLAAAMAELKQKDALIRVLNERIGGYQNERNEHIRLIKSWRKKAKARAA